MSSIYNCLSRSVRVTSELLTQGVRQTVNGVRLANEQGILKISAISLAALATISTSNILNSDQNSPIPAYLTGVVAIGFAGIAGIEKIKKLIREAVQDQAAPLFRPAPLFPAQIIIPLGRVAEAG